MDELLLLLLFIVATFTRDYKKRMRVLLLNNKTMRPINGHTAAEEIVCQSERSETFRWEWKRYDRK